MEMNISSRFYFLSFILFFLFIGDMQAQYDADKDSYGKSYSERVEIASSAIRDIKDGVLIMRLSSEKRKIEELDKLIANPDVDENKRSRLLNLKEKTFEENMAYNSAMYEGFNNHFDFAEVLFLYDTSMHKLLNGEQSGYFLNNKLEVDSSISLENRSFRVARYGRTFNTKTNAKFFFVMDKNMNDLSLPFPNGMGLTFFERLFVRPVFWIPKWNKPIQNLNKNMKRFYAKVQAKEQRRN